MKNPIVNTYEVKYSWIDKKEGLVVEKVHFSCCGGWGAINDVVESFIAHLEGAFPEARLIGITSLGPCLVVDPDLLKEIRDCEGADDAKAGNPVQELMDLQVSVLGDHRNPCFSWQEKLV